MANQGWPNGGGSGEQTSSTARTSGRGTTTEPAWRGSQQAHPGGGDSDKMGEQSDLFEVPGNMTDA